MSHVGVIPFPGRRRTAAVLIAVALSLLIPAASVAANLNPGVMPPTAKVQGLTLGDWFGRWLNWIVTIPGVDCNANQGGNVFFIPQVGPGDTEVTSCDVPAGTTLFASAGGVVCSYPGDVEDLGRYLAISSPFEWTIPGVGTSLSMAGGWQVLLAPLPPGEHTIVVHDAVFGAVAQVTAHVMVHAGESGG